MALGIGGGTSGRKVDRGAGGARRKRVIRSEGASRRSGIVDGGLVGAMFRRQATGGRGRKGGWAGVVGWGGGLGATEILSARGEFRKRVRRELEGVPEMISDVKKALASGDHTTLFSAVRAVRTKLVDGTSAPFDLPSRPSHHSRTGGGSGGAGGDPGMGAASDGQYHHGHRHGEDDDDDPYNQSSSYRQVHRLDREVFVCLGGPDLLVEVLMRPGSPSDARSIPVTIVARDTPVWNMTLVILRELCFTDQDLSEKLGSPELILYLLTMMAHQGVFDLAVGLVEEILAVKSSTYFLGEVPQLHSLVENMTSQQLAHFSRVLALLVFEPEYRQLMESAHVLRSMELLQLRRDRVVRADSVIDKNQALILSAPNLLPRLMELLRVMNFNPPLALFDEQAVELHDAHVAQVRISLVGTEGGLERMASLQAPVDSEWGYLAELRQAAEASPPVIPAPAVGSSFGTVASRTGAPAASAPRPPLPERRQEAQPRRSGESSRIVSFFRSIFRRSSQRADASDADSSVAAGAGAPAGEGGARTAAEVAGTAAERFQAVQQMAGVDGGGGGIGGVSGRGGGVGGAHSPAAAAAAAAAMATVDGVDGLASFAIRDFLNFLQPAFGGQDPSGSIASLEQALTWPMGTRVNGIGPGGAINRRRLQQPSADEARGELQVNGIMLAPHQVEVLFVLCTLLGARRKGEAHEALADLGLIDVLDTMFDRLSWGVPSRQEGPHGAHCDCNPESALRVQYLRLVHNFLDRDSNNNPLKCLLLSPHERVLFSSGRFLPNPNSSGNVVYNKFGTPESEVLTAFAWRGRATSGVSGESAEEGAKWVDTRGLLSKIVDVFMREPTDSLYRFWLASCVEAFLRGGSKQEQLFISGGGLLPHLVKEITSDGIWCTGSLQTAFDLLGELCKGNREVLEMLEASMSQKQMRRFLEVMVDNLVDSNVFMRSLVLSVEHSTFRQEFRREWAPPPRRAPPRPSVVDAEGRGDVSFGSGCGGDGGGERDGGEEEEEEEEEPCYLGHTWFDVQPQEVKSAFLAGGEQEEEEGREEEKMESQTAGGESEASSTPRIVLGLAWLRDSDGTAAAASGRSSGGGGSGGGGRGSGCRTGERKENAKDKTSSDRSAGSSMPAPAAHRGEGGFVASQKAVAHKEGKGREGEAEEVPTLLQGFLRQNTAQLVRDLMCVVNLETINHENICCLNTAVLILIFADRRGQLAQVLEEVRKLPAGRGVSREAEIISELDLDGPGPGLGDDDRRGEAPAAVTERDWPFDSTRDRRPADAPGGGGSGGGGSGGGGSTSGGGGGGGGGVGEPVAQDGPAVLCGFRRLLWFWGEYYLRGGRDRLSLEFSTHVKFWAWKRVIRLLCADDGSPTALADAPLRLPRSPYDVVRRPSHVQRQ